MGIKTPQGSGAAAGGSKRKAKTNSKHFGTGSRKRGSKVESVANDEGDDQQSELEVQSEDEYEEQGDASEVEAESLHSDALDDEDEDYAAAHSGSKRKRGVTSSPKNKRKGASKADSGARKNTAAAKVRGKAKAQGKDSPKKGRGGSARKKRRTAEGSEGEDEESELELEEGQEIVGVVVQAPKTGRGEQSAVRPWVGTVEPAMLIMRMRYQFRPGRYRRIRSTSCRSSRSRNAMTESGESVFVRRGSSLWLTERPA